VKKFCSTLLLLSLALFAQAKVHVPDSVMHKDGLYVDNLKIYNDSAIFQGAILKLDLFGSIYYPAISKGALQSYETALSFRLKQRFYPTLELGYAQGQLGVQDALWRGKGGWTSVGLDVNGMKKHVEDLDALLVGIRIGTAVQKYDLTSLTMNDPYWNELPTVDYINQLRNDWWGEVVAGCNVHIYSGLIMGWNLRLKILFTRKIQQGEPVPYYIPGFGYRNYTQWGISYYIGWKF